MTTTVKVSCNGNYVATVKVNGVEAGTVGPGNNVEKSFAFAHGGPPTVYEVSERPATPDEIKALRDDDDDDGPVAKQPMPAPKRR